MTNTLFTVARLWRLSLFHMRQFLRVPYFIELLIISTIVSGITQRLAVYAWDGDSYAAFIRTGAIGMWTTVTAAGGIIRFERFQGSLSHHFTARIGASLSLAALVHSVALCSMLAFLIALVIWLTPGAAHLPAELILSQAPILLIGIVILCVSIFGVSLVIASLFVLTPNASAYESLLLLPIFLLSGIFGVPEGIWGVILLSASPTMRIYDVMSKSECDILTFLSAAGFACLSAAAWILLGLFLLSRFTRTVRRSQLTDFTA